MLGAKLGITSKQYNIVTNGLVLNFQPSFKKSYPGTGADVFNLASGSLTPTGSLDNITTGLGFVGPSGNNGGYFTYDGTDDYIVTTMNGTSTGNFGSGASKEFTISFWLNADRNAGVAFNWGDTHSSLYPYVLIYPNSGNITYLMWTGAGVPTWVHSTIAYPLGVWGHIALSRTASDNTWRLYINGVADTTIDDTGSTGVYEANAQKIWLGEGVYAPTLGNIGPFLLYNRALPLEEILQNYNATKDRYTN